MDLASKNPTLIKIDEKGKINEIFVVKSVFPEIHSNNE